MLSDTALPKLLLMGCGKMGGAMLKGMAGRAKFCVIDPATPQETLKHLPNVVWFTSLEALKPTYEPDLIIIAIKPQYMRSVLPAYARFKSSAFLSIAAGTTIQLIENLLGNRECAVVRSMPNLPASIGQGMSVACANKNVSDVQRDLCDRVLKAIGITVWVEDESLLDPVTALSGSGPAYVFALCETMAKAGEALGLPHELAVLLARQTLIGSGTLLAQSAQSAEAMRHAVTSPGGTTEAALKQLLASDGLQTLMLKSMQAAVLRSKELAQLA